MPPDLSPMFRMPASKPEKAPETTSKARSEPDPLIVAVEAERARQGLGKAELANLADIHRNTLVQALSGRYTLRLGTLRKLLDALGADVVLTRKNSS